MHTHSNMSEISNMYFDLVEAGSIFVMIVRGHDNTAVSALIVVFDKLRDILKFYNVL